MHLAWVLWVLVGVQPACPYQSCSTSAAPECVGSEWHASSSQRMYDSVGDPRRGYSRSSSSSCIGHVQCAVVEGRQGEHPNVCSTRQQCLRQHGLHIQSVCCLCATSCGCLVCGAAVMLPLLVAIIVCVSACTSVHCWGVRAAPVGHTVCWPRQPLVCDSTTGQGLAPLCVRYCRTSPA